MNNKPFSSLALRGDTSGLYDLNSNELRTANTLTFTILSILKGPGESKDKMKNATSRLSSLMTSGKNVDINTDNYTVMYDYVMSKAQGLYLKSLEIENYRHLEWNRNLPVIEDRMQNAQHNGVFGRLTQKELGDRRALFHTSVIKYLAEQSLRTTRIALTRKYVSPKEFESDLTRWLDLLILNVATPIASLHFYPIIMDDFDKSLYEVNYQNVISATEDCLRQYCNKADNYSQLMGFTRENNEISTLLSVSQNFYPAASEEYSNDDISELTTFSMSEDLDPKAGSVDDPPIQPEPNTPQKELDSDVINEGAVPNLVFEEPPLETYRHEVSINDHLNAVWSEDTVPQAELMYRIHENSGTRTKEDAVILLGTTNLIEFDSIQGLDSTKPVDESILRHDGFKLKKKTKNKMKNEIAEMYVIGPVNVDSIPGTFNRTPENERISLLGRHMALTTKEHSDNFLRLNRKWSASFNKHFDYTPIDSKIMSVDEWLLTQEPKKRKLYIEARAKLPITNFSKDEYHTRQFFIKGEVQVPPSDCSLATKAPRGIQGLLSADSSLFLGGFMSGVSKCLSQNCTSKQFYYSYGATALDIGEWYNQVYQQEGSPGLQYIIMEDDFSSFDSTQGIGAMTAEHEVYDLILNKSTLDMRTKANIRLTLDREKMTHGKGSFYTYSNPATRKSGSQHTSPGNTIVNFKSHYYAIMEWNEKHRDQKHGKIMNFRMMGLGDDNVLAIAIEPEFYASWETFAEKLISSIGLKPKMARNKNTSYCSSYFMPIIKDDGSHSFLLVPSVTRVLTKMGWSLATMAKGFDKSTRVWGNLHGITSNQQMPVMRVFYEHFSKLGVKASYSNDYQAIDKKVHGYQPTRDIEEWFSNLYNVTTAEVMELESYLKSSLTRYGKQPFAWSHPVFRKMLA